MLVWMGLGMGMLWGILRLFGRDGVRGFPTLWRGS